YREGETSVGRLADGSKFVWSEDLTSPLTALQNCPNFRHFSCVVRMYINQHGGSVRNRKHIVAPLTPFDPAGNEFRVDVDHTLDGLMAVIRPDKQQHIVARCA